VGRSTLQRVRYALREGVLYREHWPVLDAQLTPEPLPRRLLDGVRSFSLRYMDEGRQWKDSWPPAALSNGAPTDQDLRRRPFAVEVTLQLEDWGTITRIIEVAG
ncbi:MAG: type II secretion system protein GspJ, partial [Steroidobacteraceae bacterium]